MARISLHPEYKLSVRESRTPARKKRVAWQDKSYIAKSRADTTFFEMLRSRNVIGSEMLNMAGDVPLMARPVS